MILGYDHRISLGENKNTVKSVSHKVWTELISLKKKYPMISDVLRIVEVYIKKNPNVRLVLLGYDNDIAQRYQGVYLHLDRSFLMVLTLGNFPNEGSWIDTFIHELTHFAMDILYNNAANPFEDSNTLAIQSYKDLIRDLNGVLLRNYRYKHNSHKVVFYEKEFNGKTVEVSSHKPYCLNHAFTLFEDVHNYPKESHDSEYIARAVQLYASSERLGLSNDSEEDRLAIKAILELFNEYWSEYIKPDMDKYISENSENDNLLVCEVN